MSTLMILLAVVIVLVIILVVSLAAVEHQRRKLTAGVVRKMIDGMSAQCDEVAALSAPSEAVKAMQPDFAKSKIDLAALRKTYDKDAEGNALADTAVVQMDWTVIRAHWKLVRALVTQLKKEKATIPAGLLARKMTKAEKST